MKLLSMSFFFFFLLFSITTRSKADTGCLVTLSVPQNRIYIEQYPGSQSNPVRFFTSTYYDVACPVGANSSNQHPGNVANTTSPGTVCWAEFIGPGTNPNNAGNYRLNGFLVTYTMIACPVDQYTLFILFGLAVMGWYLLRRQYFAT